MPLCRWPFPRLCGLPATGFAWSQLSIQIEPSLRVSPPAKSMPRSNLAHRPQSTGTSHGLRFPTAHEGSEVHFTRARPPATFRLQGLATLLTAYSLRSRAGFVSHRQRSWDSPFGAFSSRKVSGLLPPGRTHVPFRLAVFPPPKRRAGPTGRGSWVSPLSRVPGDRQGVSSPTAGCSLGFRPSRVLRRKPWPGFRPASSRALRKPGDKSPRPPAPQSIDRPSLGPVHDTAPEHG
jgi:hypothetical protein